MNELKSNNVTAGFDRLISEKEAVEMLALDDRPNPKGTLRWLMRARRLAYVRLARGVIGFRPSDIQDYINSNLIAADRPNK